ncbi:unnamed protein product [Trichobilharzia szidati]|nr:unnamed protein product [Trichobilharzia szidati]
MLIKSELSQYKIELIDCFGEHQSQLFYGRIRIYNPCWNNNSNKCSRSLLDIKLGQTIPLDISDGNNQPVLCIPIHFFQRLNDKHNEKNRETTGGYTTNNTTTNNNGCIQLKNGFHKSSSDNVDYNKINNDNTNNNSGLSILSYDSLNEFTHQSSSSNEIDTIMEWNNKIISNICQANSALATIRVYFPVKLMNSANELKISTDLKKRFHLPPHQHEFVAYPELLTLSIDQLCVSILKGLSTANSLIPYTLSMPKEFCKSEKSQLMHNQLHPDDMMEKTEENNHDDKGERNNQSYRR